MMYFMIDVKDKSGEDAKLGTVSLINVDTSSPRIIHLFEINTDGANQFLKWAKFYGHEETAKNVINLYKRKH